LKYLSLIAAALVVTGCRFVSEQEPGGKSEGAAAKQGAQPGAPTLMFADAPGNGAPFNEPPVLRAQVILDRFGFSPGTIDGKAGQSFVLALRGFQEARGLPKTGKLDEATQAALPWPEVPATRLVQIPAAFARGPFVPDFPAEAEARAKLAALGYRNLMEALAERFHTTPETLIALNAPTTRIGAGRVIRVPNVADVNPETLGPDERGWNRTLQLLAVAPAQRQAETVIVDKSEGVLKAVDAGG
jgi:hypothetical protein